MQNFIQPGQKVTFTAGAAYSSGAFIQIGALVGVVENDVANGDNGVAVISGIVELKKKSSQTWAQGDRLYWDDSDDELTNVATSDSYFAGIAAEAAGSSAVLGKVKMNAGAPQAVNVAALGQTISGSYSQSEVQAISTKVDAVLTALKNAKLMASS